MVIHEWRCDFVLLFGCFIRKFAIFPRISLHALPCHRTMKMSFRHQVSPRLFVAGNFCSSSGNPWFKHTSVIIHNVLAYLTFSLSATQVNIVEECGSPKSTSFTRISQVGRMFRFFTASLISSTYTDKNIHFARLTNKHSQFGTFSQPFFKRTFSNCRSHSSPARGWPYRFRSRGTTGSYILDHDLGHLCFNIRIQTSGEFCLWNFQ